VVLSFGQELPLAATLVYDDGSGRDVRPDAQWRSTDDGVVQVESDGLIRAQALGTATITASYAGLSGTATVTVSGARIKGVRMVPDALALAVGQSAQLALLAYYDDGTVRGVSALAAWAALDPGVVSVSRGTVAALSPGTANVTATYRSLAASATITTR
jgi:uncharacterized protein YjdB